MNASLKPAGHELTITRVFDAPRELVFSMWTNEKHFARWCAPNGFSVLRNDADVRRGGTWRSFMCTADCVDCVVSGVYREIVAPERLVFTYAHEDAAGRRGNETVVTVTLEAQADRTKLTLHQAGFEAVPDRDAHEYGWGGCFDRLDEYLAGPERKHE